jgi:NTE family protein
MKRLLTTLLVLFFFSANAQRPKIGLTLSGGGAKGLAHIGILQALDSAGLKVDYLTGTSMGSIIGAMYAAGYSGDSIEKMARVLDWNLLFSTAPQLSTISIEEKSEFDCYAIEIPYVDGNFRIGKGIIEGQELWLKLSDVFRPVYNITDFSKMSIPFQCMGTDMETGKSVVMDHGNIVTAVRASMAIPSVFTPVKYDDKLLVDGGVVNNFPVKEARKMGADYMIGVNVSGGLLKAEELESALDILLQIGFFKDADTFEKQKAACNMYLLPDLKGYSTGSFDKADSIIDLGIEAGRKYYPFFKHLADSLNAIYGPQPFIANRVPASSEMVISKFTANGLVNTTPQFFFGLLNLKEGRIYTHEEMSTAIRRVYGSRYYRIIRYDFVPAADGTTEMHFSVEENPLTAVKFAMNYNTFTSLSLKLNMTARDLFLKESRAMASVSLSANPRIYGEYFKYLDTKRTLRGVLDYYFEAIDFPVYDNFRLYQTLRSFYHAADFQLQRNINRFSMIGIGQQFIHSRIKTLESPSLIYNGSNDSWKTYLSYLFNNVDRKYFTTKGWYINFEAGYTYGQDPKYTYSFEDSTVSSESLGYTYDDYAKLRLRMSHFSRIDETWSWSQHFFVGSMMTSNPFIADRFLVGGVDEIIRNQATFAGLSEAEIKTGSISTLQLALQYAMSKKLFLTGRVNGAVYDFYKKDLNELGSSNFLSGYGLTMGYDSPLGPIEFTSMYCDQDGKVRSTVNIGYTF